MSTALHPKNSRIQSWLQKLQKNMKGFKESNVDMTLIERIEFVRGQYHHLFSIRDVVDGKIVLDGVNTDNFKNNE